MARLQLGAALFHHSTIKCDRGCEGNDDESDLTSDDEDDDNASTTSWDDSISEPSSNASQGQDSSSSDSDSDNEHELPDLEDQEEALHEPSIPQMPRILSSSESDSDDLAENLGRLRVEVTRSTPNTSASNSFFNFGGSDEHQSIRQYVQQMVQEPFFDHSTDSETDVEDELS